MASYCSNLKLCKLAVPSLSGARHRFRGRQFFHGWGVGGWGGWLVQAVTRAMGGMVQAVMRAMGSGGNASAGERWGAADEASLARPPLTSCCAARFLTRRRLVAVRGPGIGDPCCKQIFINLVNNGIYIASPYTSSEINVCV